MPKIGRYNLVKSTTLASKKSLRMLAGLPSLAVFVPSAITRNALLIPAFRASLATLGLSAADGPARALMLALGVLNPLASSMLLTGGLVSMTAAALLGGFSWLRWFMLIALPYCVLLLSGHGDMVRHGDERLCLGQPDRHRPQGMQKTHMPHAMRCVAVLCCGSLSFVRWVPDSTRSHREFQPGVTAEPNHRVGQTAHRAGSIAIHGSVLVGRHSLGR